MFVVNTMVYIKDKASFMYTEEPSALYAFGVVVVVVVVVVVEESPPNTFSNSSMDKVSNLKELFIFLMILN